MIQSESPKPGRKGPFPLRAVSRIFAPGSGPPRQTRPAERSPVVDWAYYIDGVRQPTRPSSSEESPGRGRAASAGDYAAALADARTRDDAFVWLGLHEPTLADLTDIAAIFDLDEFAVEDAVKGGQRAKLEQYGAMTFLVVRTASYLDHPEHPAPGEQPGEPAPGRRWWPGRRRENPPPAPRTETETVRTGDLMMFVGQHFIITVRHGEVGALGPVRAELERRPELLRLGPWAVVYAIVDRVVDTYIQITSRLEEDIDDVESQVFARHVHGRIARIYQIKREVIEFKRAVVPAQRPLALLAEGRVGAMPKEITRHFRDVHDHLVRTVEQVVSYDEMLNSILQARLAQVTVDQNNDMRKIASWAAIAAVQTTIAGIYGMNFDYMPELHWRYAYGFVLLFMFGTAIAMYRLFRRSGWL
jgi:magnesium transporter